MEAATMGIKPITESKPEIETDETTPNPAPAPDPFDLASLRLDQSFAETAGVKKLLNTVPVGRPNPQDFVRVHPSEDYRETFALIELKADREFYVLHRDIARELPSEFFMAALFTAINRQGVVRIVPVRLPGADGKVNEWHRSLMDAVQAAMHHWVRIKANMALGAYETFEVTAAISEPVWPEVTFQELLRIGFRDRVVDRVDHPLVKRLRGLG
jgi:hypothetical protein